MAIEIKTPSDLAQLTGSIIRSVEMLGDPARILIAIDGPDEMRYSLTATPQYSISGTPMGVIVTLGLNLNLGKDTQ